MWNRRSVDRSFEKFRVVSFNDGFEDRKCCGRTLINYISSIKTWLICFVSPLTTPKKDQATTVRMSKRIQSRSNSATAMASSDYDMRNYVRFSRSLVDMKRPLKRRNKIYLAKNHVSRNRSKKRSSRTILRNGDEYLNKRDKDVRVLFSHDSKKWSTRFDVGTAYRITNYKPSGSSEETCFNTNLYYGSDTCRPVRKPRLPQNYFTDSQESLYCPVRPTVLHSSQTSYDDIVCGESKQISQNRNAKKMLLEETSSNTQTCLEKIRREFKKLNPKRKKGGLRNKTRIPSCCYYPYYSHDTDQRSISNNSSEYCLKKVCQKKDSVNMRKDCCPEISDACAQIPNNADICFEGEPKKVCLDKYCALTQASFDDFSSEYINYTRCKNLKPCEHKKSFIRTKPTHTHSPTQSHDFNTKRTAICPTTSCAVTQTSNDIDNSCKCKPKKVKAQTSIAKVTSGWRKRKKNDFRSKRADTRVSSFPGCQKYSHNTKNTKIVATTSRAVHISESAPKKACPLTQTAFENLGREFENYTRSKALTSCQPKKGLIRARPTNAHISTQRPDTDAKGTETCPTTSHTIICCEGEPKKVCLDKYCALTQASFDDFRSEYSNYTHCKKLKPCEHKKSFIRTKPTHTHSPTQSHDCNTKRTAICPTTSCAVTQTSNDIDNSCKCKPKKLKAQTSNAKVTSGWCKRKKYDFRSKRADTRVSSFPDCQKCSHNTKNTQIGANTSRAVDISDSAPKKACPLTQTAFENLGRELENYTRSEALTSCQPKKGSIRARPTNTHISTQSPDTDSKGTETFPTISHTIICCEGEPKNVCLDKYCSLTQASFDDFRREYSNYTRCKNLKPCEHKKSFIRAKPTHTHSSIQSHDCNTKGTAICPTTACVVTQTFDNIDNTFKCQSVPNKVVPENNSTDGETSFEKLTSGCPKRKKDDLTVKRADNHISLSPHYLNCNHNIHNADVKDTEISAKASSAVGIFDNVPQKVCQDKECPLTQASFESFLSEYENYTRCKNLRPCKPKNSIRSKPTHTHSSAQSHGINNDIKETTSNNIDNICKSGPKKVYPHKDSVNTQTSFQKFKRGCCKQKKAGFKARCADTRISSSTDTIGATKGTKISAKTLRIADLSESAPNEVGPHYSFTNTQTSFENHRCGCPKPKKSCLKTKRASNQIPSSPYGSVHRNNTYILPTSTSHGTRINTLSKELNSIDGSKSDATNQSSLPPKGTNSVGLNSPSFNNNSLQTVDSDSQHISDTIDNKQDLILDQKKTHLLYYDTDRGWLVKPLRQRYSNKACREVCEESTSSNSPNLSKAIVNSDDTMHTHKSTCACDQCTSCEDPRTDKCISADENSSSKIEHQFKPATTMDKKSVFKNNYKLWSKNILNRISYTGTRQNTHGNYSDNNVYTNRLLKRRRKCKRKLNIPELLCRIRNFAYFNCSVSSRNRVCTPAYQNKDKNCLFENKLNFKRKRKSSNNIIMTGTDNDFGQNYKSTLSYHCKTKCRDDCHKCCDRKVCGKCTPTKRYENKCTYKDENKMKPITSSPTYVLCLCSLKNKFKNFLRAIGCAQNDSSELCENIKKSRYGTRKAAHYGIFEETGCDFGVDNPSCCSEFCQVCRKLCVCCGLYLLSILCCPIVF